MKKIIVILVAVLFVIFPSGVFADEVNNSNTFKLDINSSDVEISEPMTFDELVISFANNEGVTVDEAKALLGISSAQESYNINSARAKQTFRTISQTLNVSNEYKPKINFYIETDESRYYGFIKEVKWVNFNRIYNDISYFYDGTLYCNLEDVTTIYYTMDGDWFLNGKQSAAIDLNLKVNESISVGITSTYSSEHYKGFYCANKLHWGKA